MKILTRNILIAFLILFILAGAFSLFIKPTESPKQIIFSEFISLVNEDKVQKISIEKSDLTIELKDGSKAKTLKESESSLTETLKNYGIVQEKITNLNLEIKEPAEYGAWISIFTSILLPFLIIGFFVWFMFRKVQGSQMQAFSFGQSKAKLANGKEKVTFADVAGLKEVKEELKEIVEFLRKPKKFLDIGARIPRGVLLMGSPGTGKTLLARAVAGEAGVPFFYMSGSEFVEMFVGVGASRVRDLFTTAKKSAPCIIFVDELDAVGRQRGAGLGGGNDEREQTLNQILVEMDGFEKDTNVIVIAATNRPDVLDPALLRPGRFDRQVVLDLPDISEREEILKIHIKNKIFDKEISLKRVAERTPGFSGADLANLVNEAAILAARGERKFFNQQDLYDAMEKVLLGPERKSNVLSKKEKEITAYHEAGHALIAASLKDSDPVHKISIIPRGRVGGFTMKLPIEDRRLHTKSHFLADLAVSLGGYAAEQIVFEELTTGASNDLRVATDLARRLVTQYGMSDKLGPRTFGHKEEMVFLGREIHEERNYSEKISAMIDEEVGKFMGNAYKTAKKIITEKRNKLEQIAKRLMEAETIERDEFDLLMKAA
ncbi:MAG: ATP-dependent zinc metalloprotease FtsH [Parcubacteria group bacterium GW2011_GWD2_38_12]|nr:MAG: ATP-dependent zinc metalloprotease FtsH [Parcubacteria group bacterium GW2011_GWC2_36_17]KKQ43737.1 MAG: ATP-dependent zinc metalloprotease FtsH [Parcubacteria group bacterium GW2011_GWE2_37_8]KKQ52616.1 MAG: ATP-dependent zinc metalloprotease FtsH [Parcubacteria group bacterium GW2011_GWD2_38_12]KKQ58864.1 MAG: ATP-dependent zinc metalloprotease FtsH [Parcubacteria group bacterium GW2011_GWC1_38_17]KKQ59569.1 MAG: ATP-dependent zinc metalloprotease FtsH [Parcubacteria group bacterium G